MLYLRWLFGANLVAVFLLLLVGNTGLVVRALGGGHRRSSLALIVGGLAGLLGFLVLPVDPLHRLFWIPPIADISVPYGIALLATAATNRSRA